MTPRVTYKGANANNPQKVIIVTGTNARARADLMTKISQILSILSFIISASMLGAGVYGYMMVTSDEFKEKMSSKLLEKISNNKEEWRIFSNYLFYQPDDLQDLEQVKNLATRLSHIDKKQATHGNKTFYLSVLFL